MNKTTRNTAVKALYGVRGMMRDEVACPKCGYRMELQKAVLLGREVSAFMCPQCSAVVYDFSGRGEICRSCSSSNTCLWG